MASSTVNAQQVLVTTLVGVDETVTAELRDGRTISIPLFWSPRLRNGIKMECEAWRLIGGTVWT